MFASKTLFSQFAFWSLVAVPFAAAPLWAQDTAQRKQLAELVKKIGVDEPQNVQFKIDSSIQGFSVKTSGPAVSVNAGTLNELAAGYGYYLKHGKNVSWSWSASRRTPVEVSPKTVFEAVSPWQWRYAYNYCTLSYTSAFWGEKEWKQEIDRMALNGINRMLVQAGLEKVWQLTLTELGYPKEKIIDYIPNPAFAAWWNMGNLEGYGGPLSQRQIDREAALGKSLVAYMRNYGIEPILQGFIGLVPHDFGEYYKKEKTKIIPQGKWCDGFTRPAVLDPTCEAFPKIAAVWYKNLEKVYGVKAKAFGGDLFHEGGQSKGVSVADAASAVQKAMQKASPESIWVLQAWHANPSEELLSGLDKKHCLVLTLCKNLATGTDRAYSYHGAPWVWCELSNFGGNHGLYGSLKALGKIGKMASEPDSKQLVGIGLIPEGTEVNPVTYDLLYDRLWMPRERILDDTAIAQWLQGYTLRRYGKNVPELNEAWKLLERSVYSPTQPQEGCTESILCARPDRNTHKASTWASGKVYWNPKDVHKAFALLVQAAEKNPEPAQTGTFRWDLCDVGRQFLSDLARPLLAKAMEAYDARDAKAFEQYSEQFLDLIDSTDRLLATHPLWHFGRMYQMALAKGKNKAEKENETRALKTLVTSWSGKRGALNDYAHRQLAGLMKDYYFVRWNAFFDAHKQDLAGNSAALKALDKKIDQLLTDWPKENKNYQIPKTKKKQTLAEAQSILKKFTPLAEKLFSEPAERDRAWSLGNGVSEFVFDVSDDIMQTGTFTATFQWKRGRSALAIKAVRLYEGDKLVAEDVHDGSTGIKNENNVYRLEVKKLREGLDAYTLKAEVSGVSSEHSSGTLIFKKN